MDFSQISFFMMSPPFGHEKSTNPDFSEIDAYFIKNKRLPVAVFEMDILPRKK